MKKWWISDILWHSVTLSENSKMNPRISQLPTHHLLVKTRNTHPKEPVSIALNNLDQVACNVFGSQSTPHLSSPMTLACAAAQPVWSSPIPPQYHFRQSMQYLWSWCLHMLTRDHREMDMTCQHFNIALHDLIFRHNIRGLKSQLLVLSDHGWWWT